MRWVDVFIHPSSGGTSALPASRSAHVLEKQTGATTRPRYAELNVCLVSGQEMSSVRTDVWADLLCVSAHMFTS